MQRGECYTVIGDLHERVSRTFQSWWLEKSDDRSCVFLRAPASLRRAGGTAKAIASAGGVPIGPLDPFPSSHSRRISPRPLPLSLLYNGFPPSRENHADGRGKGLTLVVAFLWSTTVECRGELEALSRRIVQNRSIRSCCAPLARTIKQALYSV